MPVAAFLDQLLWIPNSEVVLKQYFTKSIQLILQTVLQEHLENQPK
jgi:hypothetical protein